jgi:hypothetical protein
MHLQYLISSFIIADLDRHGVHFKWPYMHCVPQSVVYDLKLLFLGKQKRKINKDTISTRVSTQLEDRKLVTTNKIKI